MSASIAGSGAARTATTAACSLPRDGHLRGAALGHVVGRGWFKYPLLARCWWSEEPPTSALASTIVAARTKPSPRPTQPTRTPSFGISVRTRRSRSVRLLWPWDGEQRRVQRLSVGGCEGATQVHSSMVGVGAVVASHLRAADLQSVVHYYWARPNAWWVRGERTVACRGSRVGGDAALEPPPLGRPNAPASPWFRRPPAPHQRYIEPH